ncbi:CPBP family intramembrane metalloprotease [Psychrosphaera sp. B3R10]|uniref:CPBP family intramembrane metalloprotease n=1 Tax=Psychrosphaera algicola TaxID=3023714 RepID=A0ABT5FFH8_9GAMM|nr:CPBP family intramembrane glutamic endopeptidase [Psychrosphaera sp. G1-22]MBU2883169.1 CPBP family intramembrane metalloprotease [Psychrosphaera sp. I2R16]MBU2988625.1 CPBP family intramembrane metalloprotease [Psychrosphaera sp. B3R10]MDC2890292.1 CPBP family intramembrane metalloprotease [Psychrosphaera sp. G1-22]
MVSLTKAYYKPVMYVEFVLLFIVLPIVVYFLRHTVAPYLLLCLITILLWCLLSLVTDPRFKRFRLWNLEKLREFLPNVMKTFLLAAFVITLASWWFTPQWLFSLPLEQTLMWIALLFLYPVLSAWPQEVIFRTYLFHRYKHIFKSKNLRAWLSALSFALAHLMFANWIAVVGSFFAGLVFAYTYMHSRSTLLVTLEHSLWGCWLFTAGLGIHFDSGMLT